MKILNQDRFLVELAVGQSVAWWREINYNEVAQTRQWTTGTVKGIGKTHATVQINNGRKFKVRIKRLTVMEK